MAALALGKRLSAAISGKWRHSGEVPGRDALEFLGGHADQPEGAGNLRGGRLGDRAGKPPPRERDTGMGKN